MALAKPVAHTVRIAVISVAMFSHACAEDWPFVRGDTLGSGVAASAVADSLAVLWTYRAGNDAGFEATAVVADGVIYVGDDLGTFHAVRLSNGTADWTRQFDQSSFLAAAAVDQGRIYIGDANGIVRCLSAENGEEVWSKEIEGEVYAGPTVYGDNVFITCEAGTLSCFGKTDGDERWQQFQIDAPLRCSPTIIGGHVLLAGCDSKLHRIDVTKGTETDSVAIDAPTGATAAARDGRAYFGTEGGTFYAIDVAADGDKQPAELWTYRDAERGQPIRSAAAVTEALVVYGGQGKAIYALDRASGKLKWKLPTRSRVDSSPVIAGARVVAATDRGVIYLLDAATGAVKWQFDAGGGFTASPAVVDAKVVLGNTDGTLYCFGTKPTN